MRTDGGELVIERMRTIWWRTNYLNECTPMVENWLSKECVQYGGELTI